MSYNNVNFSTMTMNNYANMQQYESQPARRVSTGAVDMAGTLFSHILTHLKNKNDRPLFSGASHSNYLLTPQKVGAFTKLTPVKRDNDCTDTTSTTYTPTRFGAMLAKPTPVYLQSAQTDSMSNEELKDESPHRSSIASFE